MFDWWERRRKTPGLKPCPVHAYRDLFLWHGASWCPVCRKFTDSEAYKKKTEDDGA